MTEELRVRLVLDDSGVRPVLNNFKNKVEGITSGLGKGSKATDAVNKSIDDLKDSIEQLRNLDALDMLVEHLDGIKKSCDGASKQFKSFGAHVKNALGSVKLGFDKKHWENLGYETGLNESFKNIKWGFDDAKEHIVAGITHIRAGFNEFGDVVNKVFPPMLRKLGLIVAAIAGVVAATKNAINTASRIKELTAEASKIGLSASAYQEWGAVLGSVGVGVDKLSDFIKTLTEEQLAVREGSEDMINSFKRLGLSAEQVINMSQEDLFKETVQRLQNVKNETDRVSIAYQIFGEDAAELTNVLRLTNAETASLAKNTYLLGAAMSDGLIEKSSALSKSVSNLKTAWQGLTQTLAELVMPIVTVVVDALTKAIVVINLFIKTLFGLDLTGSTKSALSGATGGVSSYTDAVDEATGAVNKLKRATMGFDELNIVSNPNSASGSGSGASGGGGFSMPEMGEGIGSITDKLNLNKIHDFFNQWKTVIQDVIPSTMIVIGVIGCALCLASGNIAGAAGFAAMAGIGFWAAENNGMWERLRTQLQEINLGFVPACMVGIGAIGALICLGHFNIPGALAFASMAGIGLKLGGGSDINKFLSKYESEILGVLIPSTIAIAAVGAAICMMTGNWIGALALAGVAGIAVAGMSSGKGFGEFVKNIKDYVPDIINYSTLIIGAAGAAVMALSGNILGVLGFAAMAGISLYNVSTGGNFFEDLFKAIKDVWEGLKKWFKTEVAPIFTKDWWKAKFDTIRDGAQAKLAEAQYAINEKWGELKSWWNDGPGKVFTKSYWVNKFQPIKEGAQSKLAEVRKTITDAWSNVSSYFSNNIAPKFTLSYWQNKFETIRSAIQTKLGDTRTQVVNAWTAIKNYFTSNIAPKFTLSYWKTKFDTIKDGAKSAFNGLIDVVERAINGIIKKLNTISWDIPDWVPKYGGETFGFSLKQISIPRLATGGIATRSTLANIGENGREAVLPLDNNTGWMDKLADRIAARQSTPSKIVLKVGERELGWASINGINQITKQTGELQLVL